MSSVNLILLTEASKDIVAAFEAETFAYMAKHGKEALNDNKNWKDVFDNVAARYVRDMRKKNLDPSKRIAIDIKSLLKMQNKGSNRFLYLLQQRKEVVAYLEKQIRFYNDKELSRVAKYRGDDVEAKISTMRDTPKLNKSELNMTMMAYGFKDLPEPKVGHADRYRAGVAFEQKVVDALVKREKALGNKPTHEMIEKKINIILPGEGTTFGERIYNFLEKNEIGKPSKMHDVNLVHEVVNKIDFSKQNFMKADFIFNDSMYEVKKVNILDRTLFCEFWKVADKKTLARLTQIMGSELRAIVFYNNFMRKVYTNETFKNKVIKYIRDGFKDTKLVGIVGSLNSKDSDVVIADPSALTFDFVIIEPNSKTSKSKSNDAINKFVRLAVYVKLKHTNSLEVIDKYHNIKEAVINRMIAYELLLRENNVQI